MTWKGVKPGGMHPTHGFVPQSDADRQIHRFTPPYIIMYQKLSDKVLEEIYDKGLLPLSILPTRCKREGCPEKKRFHRHGSYPRKAVYRKGIGWVGGIRIQRFLCALCGATISLILPTHYKWQRADLATQQDVASGQREPNALQEHFSKRSLQRWRQKWNGWTEKLLYLILRWLLRMKPELTLDASAYIAANPLRYLGFLLGQFSENRHRSITVTAVSRFGGWSVAEVPQCLSLSLPMESLISCQQGQAP